MASNSDNISMAVFCDFENVALGVRDANYEKFDIKPVLERLLLKGSIVVKKAYCDWDRYKGFKSTMHEANFELIEIPHVRQSGKNSADIRLVVDALDLCYTKSHVNTFVIISGDSDFSPLVSKLRENAKQVIGVGVKQSTSDLLVANCDEFIFYDDLVREVTRAAAKRKEVQDARKAQPQQQKRPGDDRRKEELEARKTQALEMVVETFDALVSERGDTGKIWASLLKDTLKRRRPEFSEVYYGFRTFGNLLEEAQARGLFEFGRDEKSGTYVYRSSGGPAVAAEQPGIDLSATLMPGDAGEEAAVQDGRAPRDQARGEGRGRGRGRGGRGQVAAVASAAAGEGIDEPVLQDAPEAVQARDDAEDEGRGRGRGGRGRKTSYRTELPFVPVTPDEVAQVEVQAEAPTEPFDVDDVAAAGAWPAVAEDVATPEPAVAADEAQPEPAKKERRRAPRKPAAKKGAAAAIDAAPVEVASSDAAAAPAIAAQDPAAALTVSPQAQAAPADEPDEAYEEEDDVNGNVMPGSRNASGPGRKAAERKPADRQAAARKPAARSRRPAKPKATPGNE
ncbi:NYN domain-containing protein [Massilia niabensis]|uniref:NYN domain-containing protein n=1 Tax=Massilia niabensis TaxID=544910 RepID=A0ABW0LBG1_9BURK